MKVLDLQCDAGHLFEGWFASHDDFLHQQQHQMVTCPLCSSAVIHKRLSAPRLNLGATELPPTTPATAQTSAASDVAAYHPDHAALQQLQAAYLSLARQVMANTEDVGERFASEARDIHQGLAPERGIRGHATPEEAQALAEEGIAVLPLPVAGALNEPLH